ncbi:MAG: hypothetical protein M0D57_08500 [Sphingobacteriales bacterium JAD_PAG50586_3]|nr:MAG: hypothetical protein M0D57_08500 [Sphingobacteriales bacterium JAD_PAG50586_3]
MGGNINSATFNKKLLYTQTSGNSYVWTGNIYNDTVDYQYTSAVSNGSISFLNSVANGQFYISATNRYGFAFGSSSISTNKFTLGANKRVIIGTSGLASGTYLYFNNIALGDTAAFTLNTSGPIGLGSASFSNSFTNVFTLTSTNPTITNTTFNKKLTVTKTAGGDVNWTGNTFNDTLDYRFTFSGGATVGFLNSTANANVYLSNTGTGYLAFGSSTTSTNKFTLAANKRIFVGPAGWTSTGTLALQNIQFNDSANFAISLSNTAAIILGNYTFNTTYNLPISITNGQISLTKGIFNKKVILTKTATAASLSYGGNTFNDTLDIRLQTGDFTTSNSLPDAYNGHIYFSNSSTGTLNIGRWLGVSSSQAISKKIYIGSAGFATGNLTFNGFTQLDTTLQSLTITGTGSLVINYSTWHSKLTIDAHLVSITQSVFNRKTAVTANSIYNISTSTFNKPFKLIKNSTTNNDWSAGNTFNDTTEFIIHGGTILFNRWGSSTHNGDLYVSNTGTGTLALGSGTYSVTFENNKRIFIGSEGFSTGGYL